ncbi:MAG TPA: DMT family transporter [Actinomycetota bacterium]|nr:DMT family transporter [Actinomycetota bacterium]
MRRETIGGGFIALSSLQFGAVVVLGKTITDTMPVTWLLSIRFAIAAVVLALGSAAARLPLRPAPGEWRKLLILGAVGYGTEASLFFLAIARGTASAVTLLFFVYPVLVLLLSLALGRGAPGLLIGGSLGAAVAGTALVVGSSGGLDVSSAGIAFALTSACSYAIYLIGMEHVLHRTPSVVAAMWVSAAASVALGIVSAATGNVRLPDGAAEWLPVIGMGVFTAGAFFGLFAGLRLIGAVRTAIIAALEPLSTAVMAVIFLDESLRTGTLIGATLILGGATAASLARAHDAEPETQVP